MFDVEQFLLGRINGRLPCLAIFLLVMVWACAWPVNIEERKVSSFPPVLDRGLVEPPPDQVVVLTSQPVTFSVENAVSDADDDVDLLQYVWFLDWPQNCQPGWCYGAFYLPGRGANKRFTINPCGALRKYLENGDWHILELIVTDGEVEIDVEKGRVVTGGYAYMIWYLENKLTCY